jgi:Domain of Unknown Function (DUF928)
MMSNLNSVGQLLGKVSWSISLLVAMPGNAVAIGKSDIFAIPSWQSKTVVGDRGNGGSKGESCPTTVVALLPIHDVEKDGEAAIWSLTHESTPTLWFYIPSNLTDKMPGQVKLRTQSETILFKVTTTKAGVIGLTIPSDLKAQEKYQWTFEVICNESDPSKNPRAFGWLQQVSNERVKKVKALPEKSMILNEEYMYFDALTNISSLKKTEKDAGTWKTLLTKWDLAEFANQEIVEIQRLKSKPAR